MKKEQWKEAAYLSFPIIYLFHGKLIFTSPVTESSLGSTARPVRLWPPLPNPVSGLYDLALGRTFKSFNSQVISMVQYCFCPNQLCCFLSLSAASDSLFIFFSFHPSLPNLFFTGCCECESTKRLRPFSCSYLFVPRKGGLVAS